MKIVRFYRVYDTGRWKICEDNEEKVLECPKCECRAFMDEYLTALGTRGLSFCPYCGADLREQQDEIVPEAWRAQL